MNVHSSSKENDLFLQPDLYFYRFKRITNGFPWSETMHKILAAAAGLGLLALPIIASAQTTNQPPAKTEAAPTQGGTTPKTPTATSRKKANATQSSMKHGTLKRQAKSSKNKRLAQHGHKMRYAKTAHGKRYVKSHRGQKNAYGFTAGKNMHRHHHRRQVEQ